MVGSESFQFYRNSATARTTLLRLFIGTVVIVICWFGATFVVLFASYYLARRSGSDIPSMEAFVSSQTGTAVGLLSFAGIWLGVWLVMRLIHHEKLASLFGASRRILPGAFLKGLVAVLITSVLSEIAIYAVAPEIGLASVSLSSWLVLLIPLCLLVFVQISSEELLFRGYLLRGLAYRFRSPWIWALVPGVVFTLLHWSGSGSPWMTACILLTIGSFTILLTAIVCATGNLSGALGAHFGNNFTGFLIISHEKSFGAFALFAGKPLQELDWTPGMTAYIALVGIVSTLLTAVLLFHPRSPLRLAPDRQTSVEAPGNAPADSSRSAADPRPS